MKLEQEVLRMHGIIAETEKTLQMTAIMEQIIIKVITRCLPDNRIP